MTRRDPFVIFLAVFLAPLVEVLESVALPMVGGPDLLVVLAVCVGWSCDLWNAASAGFVLGLIEDLVSARALGVRSVSLAMAALAVAAVKRFINPDSLSSKTIAALGSSTLADYLSWVSLRSMGVEINFSFFVKSIWLPSALWAAALIGPLYATLRFIAGILENFWPSSERKGRETAI